MSWFSSMVQGVIAGGKRRGDVVLLLHFEGTPGTSDYIDSSPYARTITETGTNYLSSAQKKFGSTSCFLNDGAVTVADAVSMELAALDFTIEWWQYVSNTNGGWAKDTIGQGDSGVYPIAFDLLTVGSDRKFRLRVSTNGSSYDVNQTWPASGHGYNLNQWDHFAVCRFGNTLTVYVNGISQGSTSFSGTVFNNNQEWSFGKCGTNGSYYAYGYIDELRMTIGLSVYTANFTPPTQPF